MKHLMRSLKYFVYIAVFFCIVVTLMFYTSNHPADATILDLFKDGAWWKILLFFVAFSGVYPLVGFSKRDIYTNGNFNDKKKEVIDLFQNANFLLKEETPTSFTFILRNKFLRILRLYEDAITVDFSSNPATISGLRKDVLRFSRSIEHIMQRDNQE